MTIDETIRKAAKPWDILIIGAGIGGVVALYYARKAGFNALLLERQNRVGGLWAKLPSWQDIQYGRLDWTLGDLPIAGEDQASIRDNIQSWVDRFGLANSMLLNTEVTRAFRENGLWTVETSERAHYAKYLISATGAHNRPVIPNPDRHSVELLELHSSALHEPKMLSGRDVTVVGGGASAFDLLDLCFEYEARSVHWVYRKTRWMIPTRKPKNLAGGPRGLAKSQMDGASAGEISRALHADLAGRYRKLGLQEIMPTAAFDLGRHQLIPGRWRMIENYNEIQRHCGEVSCISGRRVQLSSVEAIAADVLLWGTGYELDLSFFANKKLSQISRHDELAAQCGCGTRAIAEEGLYFLGAGLETTGTAPWHYALINRTIMSHIAGRAVLEAIPLSEKINHFHFAAFLAERDASSFPADLWQKEYRDLANTPDDAALPIPN